MKNRKHDPIVRIADDFLRPFADAEDERKCQECIRALVRSVTEQAPQTEIRLIRSLRRIATMGERYVNEIDRADGFVKYYIEKACGIDIEERRRAINQDISVMRSAAEFWADPSPAQKRNPDITQRVVLSTGASVSVTIPNWTIFTSDRSSRKRGKSKQVITKAALVDSAKRTLKDRGKRCGLTRNGNLAQFVAAIWNSATGENAEPDAFSYVIDRLQKEHRERRSNRQS